MTKLEQCNLFNIKGLASFYTHTVITMDELPPTDTATVSMAELSCMLSLPRCGRMEETMQGPLWQRKT